MHLENHWPVDWYLQNRTVLHQYFSPSGTNTKGVISSYTRTWYRLKHMQRHIKRNARTYIITYNIKSHTYSFKASSCRLTMQFDEFEHPELVLCWTGAVMLKMETVPLICRCSLLRSIWEALVSDLSAPSHEQDHLQQNQTASDFWSRLDFSLSLV